MNLTNLRTFVAVAEARSFTAAAKTLRVPTSSVSRAIARLESDLHSKLFERSTRKTALSAAGRVYYEHARVALGALEEGEVRLSELLGQPRGEIKITMPMHLDGGFLARQLVEFSRAHPQVRLALAPSNSWVDLNEEGFDLALRVRQKSEQETQLLVHELGSFRAWLVASPEYVRARGLPRTPQELAQHTCINLQGYRCALSLHGKSGRDTVEVEGPMQTNDILLVRQLVEQGAGIGPWILAPGEPAPQLHGLVRVLPQHVVDGPSLFVATASRKSQPLRVRLLREHLIRAYARAAGLLRTRRAR